MHFDVRSEKDGRVVQWSEEFYNQLQNKIGGGKPKMRWFFGQHDGWPSSTIIDHPPATEEEQTRLIDTLQDWKTEKYQQMIGSGEVPARPGVVELMDSARARGLRVAVCSAATKSSVVFCLENLLGMDRFQVSVGCWVCCLYVGVVCMWVFFVCGCCVYYVGLF